ncbi:hypothetical protein POM88_020808 [Heracleum sosnowskyi]|uniref:Uncharacterized protein n=1 Tax=Heracleum sosnowskyi TaxID=360622 RepID=A0AAD8MT78_9APIA|nr:hypothetical protein POM88_020808 [Heracleum sosnowskyi]
MTTYRTAVEEMEVSFANIRIEEEEEGGLIYEEENEDLSEIDLRWCLQKPLFNTQRRFRFENAWLTEPMCEQLTKDVWESTEGWSIQAKIEKCGEQLMAWGKDIIGNFGNRIKKM